MRIVYNPPSVTSREEQGTEHFQVAGPEQVYNIT